MPRQTWGLSGLELEREKGIEEPRSESVNPLMGLAFPTFLEELRVLHLDDSSCWLRLSSTGIDPALGDIVETHAGALLGRALPRLCSSMSY
jgi:hypothetical protein